MVVQFKNPWISTDLVTILFHNFWASDIGKDERLVWISD
ncbi:hypothetical protein LEP1GSC059_2812 [Leptospira noguchii serovar Panama str. CZ214]|uniref:Uncharacterized protein n=1 Tax=Leptospira noguchii serovar Panama str. CZ214 TaxID=1001595 RepID=T0FDY4_9LEPT|nr:hypothetical protein LEP1GSC059_2812 [Leptospira noguchii serovar Panama str. CZ214]